MCNCQKAPEHICDQCRSGNPCGCPPTYNIIPQPCQCCPPGTTFNGPTGIYPNGSCVDVNGNYTAPIPCPSCAETIATDCVILPEIPCLGIAKGSTLTQLINFLCSSAFIQTILTTIGLVPSLQSSFCQLVGVCPPAGSTVPVNLKVGVYCCPVQCSPWIPPSPGFPIGQCTGCSGQTPFLCN